MMAGGKMTQQVEITRTYTFPAVPECWEWEQDGDVVALYDDARDRFGEVSLQISNNILFAAADLATEATEWQAVIDAEAAQAPVIDGQPVYVDIPLALRRKGWHWKFGPTWFELCRNGQWQEMKSVRDMTRNQAVESMADIVSDAETAK
jgi:hypothetical protein